VIVVVVLLFGWRRKGNDDETMNVLLFRMNALHTEKTSEEARQKFLAKSERQELECKERET
jgi:hypothetical protein